MLSRIKNVSCCVKTVSGKTSYRVVQWPESVLTLGVYNLMEHSCWFQIKVTGLFTFRKDENATRPSILTQPRSQAVFLLVPGRRVGENPQNKVDSHLPQLKCISNICWVTGRWTWAGVFYKQSYSAHSLPSWPVVKAKKEDNSLEKYIHRNLSIKGFDHRLCQGGPFVIERHVSTA